MKLQPDVALPVQFAGPIRSQPDVAPAVSVLMDVTDGERYLDAALASLSGQTFADFEIVLCAHGVTPATRAIIEQWSEREPRLRVLWHEHLSLSRAHNTSAQAARGSLLARLDADDIALPHRLARQVAMFEQDSRLGLAGSAAELVDADGRSLGLARNPLSDGSIRVALSRCCPIIHSTVMMRTETFWRAGGYRNGLNTSEDYDLCARMIELSSAANSAEALVRYRVHAESITSKRPLRIVISSCVVRAGIIARARGEAEPFAGGVPSLRRAQAVLGLDRPQLAMTLSHRAWQARLSRNVMICPAHSRQARGFAAWLDPRACGRS